MTEVVLDVKLASLGVLNISPRVLTDLPVPGVGHTSTREKPPHLGLPPCDTI